MTAPGLSADDTRKLRELAGCWTFPANTTYLNHGSFGPSPAIVRETRRHWIERLDDQPMNFYVRELEPALLSARDQLAKFVGTDADNLVFQENATAAMNVVANSFALQPGDEVLLNNHEYGAVRRIWERATARHQARLVDAQISLPIASHEEILDSLKTAITARTRMIVISHISSPTAMIMPVQQVCELARDRGVSVCIDGPHTLAQQVLDIDQLDCDFYTASCHKWLCAPLGSGFLYVNPQHQPMVQPVIKSWGRLLPDMPTSWDQEFWWSGTRDPSGYLTVPTAIEFLESIGFDNFRTWTHAMARDIRQRLETLTGESAIVPDHDSFYGSMALVPLPLGDWSKLQRWLWLTHGIEVPIVPFAERWFVRVSCHLYTRPEHLDLLCSALCTALQHPELLEKE